MDRDHIDKVLSSYQHLGNQAYDYVQALSREDWHDLLRWFLLEIPVVPFLLIFHTTFASVRTRQSLPSDTFWLKSLVVTTFSAFGGSTLAAICSGQPAPLFTRSSNFMMSYIFIAWYLVNQYVPFRALCTWRPILAILAFGASAARTRAMFGFIDDFVKTYPRAMAGAIVLGGLSGSGGILFMSLERIIQKGLQHPSEFSTPGWGFKSAYIAAAVYYVATDPRGVVTEWSGWRHRPFDRNTVRFYISLALGGHAIVETLYGRPINPIYWIERAFYSVTKLDKIRGGASEDDVCHPAASSQGRPLGEDAMRPGLMGEGMRRRAR